MTAWWLILNSFLIFLLSNDSSSFSEKQNKQSLAQLHLSLVLIPIRKEG